MTESTILRQYLLSLPKNVRLFRNNVGRLRVGDRWIQYGLCPGSSDLIGWTVVNGVAVFTAVEIKTATGRVTPEQQRFLDAVVEAGGLATVYLPPE